MIVVLCFFPGDQALALKNVRWWNTLGGCKGHEVLVSHDNRCDPELCEAIRLELVDCFDKVYKCSAHAQIDGWPEGANYFFRVTTTWLQGDARKWPYFFWTEPDAIPLREGWLDAIVEAHRLGGKPFMGDRVQVGDIPLHMSGVGVYQNPIYLLAGECYRAHDTAWDMAAKDQIVPQAFFTDLIEHAWKHPAFHDLSELGTQIAPQTLLFHSSKDGSLIDLLAQKRGGTMPTNQKEPESGSPSPHHLGGDAACSERKKIPSAVSDAAPTVPPVGAAPVCDIFIRTYPGDYQWLAYCVLSIHKFCTGFRKIWVVSPGPQPKTVRGIDEWKVMNDETEDGYLAQQITKLYADVITSYQADYILHVDSDVIFTRPTTPQDFFSGEKLIWYYTPYHLIQTPWQPITEKFLLGASVPYEFMRRLPMMVPKWLYPRLREAAHHMHGLIVSDYIRNQPPRAFSEFNALGAYAWMYHKNLLHFVDTTSDAMPEPCAKQFHSWSGLTQSVEFEIKKILGEGEVGILPGIRVLKDDVWVLEGDQISAWVEQEGRLDHDQNLLPHILEHIRPGNTVVDAGAFIGDHTVAYANAVGSMGVVYAFEPNPKAFTCLEHNTSMMKNVSRYLHGVGDRKEIVSLSGNNGNAGGSYVGDHMSLGDVAIDTLDHSVPFGADFIKLDVEGYEVKALRGAEEIINKYRPTMVIEVNEEALKRQGDTRSGIFHWLEAHGYGWKIMQENACWNDPLYDILAQPVEEPEVLVRSASSYVLPTAPPPQATSPKEEMIRAITFLKAFSEESANNKAMVMQRLVYAGLKKPAKHPKKHEHKKHIAKAGGHPGNHGRKRSAKA